MAEAKAFLMAVGCAELYTVLVRTREITILTKAQSQRTSRESNEVKRGLGRAVLLEMFLFVPLSCLLMLSTVAPFIQSRLLQNYPPNIHLAFNGMMGVISYNFPFELIRKTVTKVALQMLVEFASIAKSSLDNQ